VQLFWGFGAGLAKHERGGAGKPGLRRREGKPQRVECQEGMGTRSVSAGRVSAFRRD